MLLSRNHWRHSLVVLLAIVGAPCLTRGLRADELDDAATPIEEASPRTPQAQTHLDALSLFAAGRIEEQKEHLAEALRLYQRALRCDPEALPIIREIVPLAFNLERPNEAVRYALKAAEIDPSDPLLLRQLGLHLAEAGRFQQALKLYKQARAGLPSNPPSPAYILLSMELGRLCFVTDHPQEAAEAFAIVLPAVEDPDKFELNDTQKKLFVGSEGVRSLELMAEAFLAADHPEDAQKAYERLEAMRPNKALHAFHLARVAAAKKQPQAALDNLQVYFDEHGTSAGTAPYQMLTRLLTELGQQDQIIERLEALAAAEPKNREMRQTLAAALMAAGQNDKAEVLFKELLKAQSNEDAYLGLIKLYSQARRWQELVKLLGDAAADRDALDLLDEQVKEIAKNQETVDQLIKVAQQAYQTDPDSLDYGDRMALALVALEARKFDAAREFFNLALKVKREDAAGLFEAWGVGLILAEQYVDAAAIFQRAIDEQVLPEGNSVFHHYLAGALEMAGKTDDALAVARAAIAMPDAPPRMYSRLAWVLYHAKRNTEAEQAYRDFLNRFDSQYESEELRTLLRDARLILSNLCATREDMRQAEELLEQVLDEYPENTGALNDLGYLWVEQHKNLDRALRMIEQAIEADPDNEAYLDSLGWAYFQTGRFAEAVEELKKAVAAGGDDPDGTILDHLGDACEKAGQPDAARAAWQRAIEQLENNKDAEKAAAVRQKLDKASADTNKKQADAAAAPGT
ncbi:MAG TPA: tetratricopeptide repeat protein [Pirellulales bacterium]|nr:tetratricopeptide repeat protein [Pirellulales bacterium]